MRVRTFLVALLMLAAAASAQAQVGPDRFSASEAAFAPGEAVEQARLLTSHLDALAPQRRGRTDVYLIVASLWSDAVFESEATQAEEILRTHFGAAARDRSIILSAGGRGARAHPAATPNNLSAAIGQVGSLVDPEEDLVVVFITSHGSSDGSVAALEHNRMSASLRPAHLQQMLTAANIVNRVIIVSACFSGGFIPPFADDGTIVLTAAAQDRTSFGCQPQRDWTFFGDALFSRNLRESKPLLQSFQDATVLIAQWEREQNLTPPSNPQQYVGQRAADLLRRAEQSAR